MDFIFFLKAVGVSVPVSLWVANMLTGGRIPSPKFLSHWLVGRFTKVRPLRPAWRLRLAASWGKGMLFLPVMAAICNPMGLAIVLGEEWRAMGVAYLYFVCMTAIAYGWLGTGKTGQRLDDALRLVAAAKMCRVAGSAEVQVRLSHLADSHNPVVNEKVRAMLQALVQKEAAAASPNPPSLDLDALSVQLLTYTQMLRPRFNAERETHLVDVDGLEEVGEAIDELLAPQAALRAAYPLVACLRCGARPSVQAGSDWWWMTCPVCEGTSHLSPGVRAIEGTIGPAVAGLVGDILRVPLWDSSDKRVLPIPADIGAVVVSGGGDMDYDWALSAVLERLIDGRRDLAKGLKVRLADQPPLSPNTLNMLRQTVQEVVS